MGSPTIQPSPRVLANRRNGALGGKARAKALSKSQRQRIAAMGGKRTRDLYGTDFYSHIDKKRTVLGRNRKPVS